MKKAEKIDSTIKKTMKNLRLQAKLSQDELADILAAPRSFIDEYEDGERILSFGEAWNIANAMEVSPQTLIQLTNYNMGKSIYDPGYEKDEKILNFSLDERIEIRLTSIDKNERDLATLKHEAFEAGKAEGKAEVRAGIKSPKRY